MAEERVRNVILLGKPNAGKKTISRKFSALTTTEPLRSDTHIPFDPVSDPMEVCIPNGGALPESLEGASSEGGPHLPSDPVHRSMEALAPLQTTNIFKGTLTSRGVLQRLQKMSPFKSLSRKKNWMRAIICQVNFPVPFESSALLLLKMVRWCRWNYHLRTWRGPASQQSENEGDSIPVADADVPSGKATRNLEDNNGAVYPLSSNDKVPFAEAVDHSFSAINIINPLGEQEEDEDENEDALSQVEADRIIANLFNETDISCILICIEAQTRIPSIFSTLREYAKRFHKFVDIIAVCITKCDKKGENCWTNEHLKQKIEATFGLRKVVFWERSTTAAQMRSDLIGTDIFSLDCPPPRIEEKSYYVSFPRNDYNPIKPGIMLREAVAKYQRLADVFDRMEDSFQGGCQKRVEAHSHFYNFLMESLKEEKRVFEAECGLEINSSLAKGHLRNLEVAILDLFPRLLFSIESRVGKRAEKERHPVSACSHCKSLREILYPNDSDHS